MLFLRNNFWTTNARKAIKSYYDSHSSLVSKQNFGHNIGLLCWSPGPSKLGQNGLKPTSIMTSPTKTSNPKISNIFLIEPTGLAASLESFNRSLAELAGEL